MIAFAAARFVHLGEQPTAGDGGEAGRFGALDHLLAGFVRRRGRGEKLGAADRNIDMVQVGPMTGDLHDFFVEYGGHFVRSCRVGKIA
jgi:hypothetical protein